MSNHEHEHCGCGCEHHDHKPVADKYMTAINQSNVTTDDAAVAAAVQEIIDKHAAENNTPEVQQFLLNCVDLTTLATEDSERSVAKFVQKVNDFDNNYPQYKNVAAICVYSNFAAVVRGTLEVSGVDVAVCSACFPSSQAHIETKIAETALAVADGADEVDIVLNVGYFKDEAYEELCDEIAEIKQVVGERPLKVILESGYLKTAENIRNASILSMYSGCDFIKTSTGKIYPDVPVHQGVLHPARPHGGLQGFGRYPLDRGRCEVLHHRQGGAGRAVARQPLLPHRRVQPRQRPVPVVQRHRREAVLITAT